MGVPIGDVARVSQVLLASLHQDRTTTADRSTPSLITSESVNTTAVQSSGNVETQTGFFLGDAGFLSNVNVGLQRVTDIGNVTTNSITASAGVYVNGVSLHDSNIIAYDKITLNSINVPRYMTITSQIGGVSTSYQLDISGDAQTIVYGGSENFRAIKIDAYSNVISDKTTSNPVTSGVNSDINFGEQVAVNDTGTTIACGAIDWDGPYNGYFNSGAVFVYRYDGENWNQLGSAIDAAADNGGYSEASRIRFANGNFGCSLCLNGDGNTLIAGARNETNYNGGNSQLYAGAAYVYTYNGSSWTRTASLFSDSRSQSDRFGTSVYINKSGNKIAIGSGSGEVYIYNNLSLAHKITNGANAFGDRVAINEDGTVMATVSDSGHHIYNYDGENWTETLFPPNGIWPSRGTHVSVTDSGDEAVINGNRYIYFEGAWSIFETGYSGYTKINNDGYRMIDMGTTYFSTVNPTYKLDVAGDANVYDMHALRYHGDGGTLSNIVLEENVSISSTNYNGSNVFGSNSTNYYQTDTISTSVGTNLIAMSGSGTRVAFSNYGSDSLPFVYDYDGTTWSQTTQMTSTLYSTALENVYDVDISDDGETIAIASGTYLYIWNYNGSSWTESQYGTGSNTYNCLVSGDGNVVLAGDTNTHLVYVVINGTYSGTFTPSLAVGNDDLKLVGINYDGTKVMLASNDFYGTNLGNTRIFTFTRSGSSWSPQHQIDVGGGNTNSQSFSVNQDFTVFAYMINGGPLRIYEYDNNAWLLNEYVGPSGLTSIRVEKLGVRILATNYMIHKKNGAWEHKAISTPSNVYRIRSANSSDPERSRFVFGRNANPGVVSEIRIDTTLNINATNVNISGTLTKASGTFKIDHPLPNMESTHSLTHSFIEGPKADLIYRGKAQLENGSVIVNIDEVSRMTGGTFEALTRDIQCFVSNETNWDAVRGVVDCNSITIHSQNTTSNSIVSWLVIGERKDKHMYSLDWTDNDGRVVPEKLKM